MRTAGAVTIHNEWPSEVGASAASGRKARGDGRCGAADTEEISVGETSWMTEWISRTRVLLACPAPATAASGPAAIAVMRAETPSRGARALNNVRRRKRIRIVYLELNTGACAQACYVGKEMRARRPPRGDFSSEIEPP